MNSSGIHPRKQRGKQAFTLTDLLVVMTVVTVLATVALASQGSSEHVLRAQCASNLRQIAVALNVYAADSGDYLPLCKFSDSTPWYTYEVARVDPGTSNLWQGYMNLGLLVRTKAASEAHVLYCPAQLNNPFTYDYYDSTGSGWPTTPVGSGDDNIRAGYSYFPQLRATQTVSGGLVLPKATTTSVSYEVGAGPVLVPARLSEINPQRSIVTDLVHVTYKPPHQTQGSTAGLNALFADGTVAFQNARTDPQQFEPSRWQDINSNSLKFRVLMNGWQR